MKIHTMHLNSNAFNLIKSGKQKIEVRLYDKKRRKISIGDIIVYEDLNSKKTLSKQVKYLHIYPTFKELFNNVGVVKWGWEKEDTVEHAVKVMSQYYSKEEENQYGVVGIELK